MPNFFEPKLGKISLYDSGAPEHLLIDSMAQEYIDMASQRILYWRFYHSESVANQDNLDKLYGEQQNSDSNIYDQEPLEVSIYTERSPILQELNRMGISIVEELTCSVTVTYIKEKLGRLPLSGDVFRVSNINLDQKERWVLYQVSTVNPSDMFMGRYISLIITADKFSPANMPQHIQDYLYKE